MPSPIRRGGSLGRVWLLWMTALACVALTAVGVGSRVTPITLGGAVAADDEAEVGGGGGPSPGNAAANASSSSSSPAPHGTPTAAEEEAAAAWLGAMVLTDAELAHEQQRAEALLAAWPAGRPRGCLFVLARNSDLKGVLASVSQLERRFNRRAQYPWIFVNDQPFTRQFK